MDNEQGPSQREVSNVAISEEILHQKIDRMTVTSLLGYCRSRFRMTKAESSSRKKIYEALKRQPVCIQQMVYEDVSAAVIEGNIKYTRLKRNRDDPSGCDVDSLQPRRRPRIEISEDTRHVRNILDKTDVRLSNQGEHNILSNAPVVFPTSR